MYTYGVSVEILFCVFLQILYSEQVRGFPGRRVLTLRCELFGLAGHYALFLRPTTNAPTIPHTAAYIKVCFLFVCSFFVNHIV